VRIVLVVVCLAGCSPATESPLSEMMALTAQGHVACVRDGALARDKECRK
jgi:hypothetical protein